MPVQLSRYRCMHREMNRLCANEREATLEAKPRTRIRTVLSLGGKRPCSHVAGGIARFETVQKRLKLTPSWLGLKDARLLELQSNDKHSISSLGGRKGPATPS